jgi:uncharacterized membrane protein
MDKSKKIFLLTLGGVILLIGGYFTITYLKIKAAYSSIVTEQQAVSIIDLKTEDIEPLNDNDIIDDNDEPSGVMLGIEDEIEEIPTTEN